MSSPASTKYKYMVKKEQGYIDAIFKNLQKNHRTYAHEIENRFEIESEHLGAWYELMVYDWLLKQGKNPSPQPLAPDGKSKPDFIFTLNDKSVYIDVASVQESKKDEELDEGEAFIQNEKRSSFATMRERLIDKAGRHKSISNVGGIYIICLGLESPFIDSEDVKTCFIGNDSYNIPSGKLRAAINGEIFEQESNGSFLVKYKNVSAILVAKRNYSLEDTNKLTFEFIQNPYAINEISPTEFGEISRFVVLTKTEEYFKMVWQH